MKNHLVLLKAQNLLFLIALLAPYSWACHTSGFEGFCIWTTLVLGILGSYHLFTRWGSISFTLYLFVLYICTNYWIRRDIHGILPFGMLIAGLISYWKFFTLADTRKET